MYKQFINLFNNLHERSDTLRDERQTIAGKHINNNLDVNLYGLSSMW